MIVSRLCGFFDEVLVLEKIRQRNDVTPMFRNLLEYSYKSHIILCAVVLGRVPQGTKLQNVSQTIIKLTYFNLLIEMGHFPSWDLGSQPRSTSTDQTSEARVLIDNVAKQSQYVCSHQKATVVRYAPHGHFWDYKLDLDTSEQGVVDHNEDPIVAAQPRRWL